MQQEWLVRVVAGHDLQHAEMQALVETWMQGQVDVALTAALLTALKMKGETAAEIAGAAQAMRQHMTRIPSRHPELIDTCGTGGDDSGTFNISTAAAIVTAAAGMPVAKHGNRRASSRTGSADVLGELGLNLEADLATVGRCLDQFGLSFCFAPLWHTSMRHLLGVRRTLGISTLFNYLGPLANPAGACYQVIGVGRPAWRVKLAEALHRLGTRRAIVVWGTDGLDEVTLAGPTEVSLVTPGGITELTWQPSDFGLASSSREALLAADAVESAALIRRVLDGVTGPPRDIVVANAAAALWTAERFPTLTEAARQAEAAIDSGAAKKLLADLIAGSQSTAGSTHDP